MFTAHYLKMPKFGHRSEFDTMAMKVGNFSKQFLAKKSMLEHPMDYTGLIWPHVTWSSKNLLEKFS
jgi:hypothetical protein